MSQYIDRLIVYYKTSKFFLRLPDSRQGKQTAAPDKIGDQNPKQIPITKFLPNILD